MKSLSRNLVSSFDLFNNNLHMPKELNKKMNTRWSSGRIPDIGIAIADP